jgi:hypothetical protein
MRRQLDFLSPKYFYIIWLSMSLDFISESYRASLNLISTFLFHESGFTLCNNQLNNNNSKNMEDKCFEFTNYVIDIDVTLTNL